MYRIPDEGVVTTPSQSICWLEDGILFGVAADKLYLEIEEARKMTEAFKKLSNKPLPVFVDLATSAGQTPETRKYFATDPAHLSTYNACALYVSNPVARVIANIYMGLMKPSRPTRLFTEYDDAIDWLNQFKEG